MSDISSTTAEMAAKSLGERVAAGKALRKTATRAALGQWKLADVTFRNNEA
jgi:hypothetical protein